MIQTIILQNIIFKTALLFPSEQKRIPLSLLAKKSPPGGCSAEGGTDYSWVVFFRQKLVFASRKQ
jgi:hypothetical protein